MHQPRPPAIALQDQCAGIQASLSFHTVASSPPKCSSSLAPPGCLPSQGVTLYTSPCRIIQQSSFLRCWKTSSRVKQGSCLATPFGKFGSGAISVLAQFWLHAQLRFPSHPNIYAKLRRTRDAQNVTTRCKRSKIRWVYGNMNKRLRRHEEFSNSTWELWLWVLWQSASCSWY